MNNQEMVKADPQQLAAKRQLQSQVSSQLPTSEHRRAYQLMNDSMAFKEMNDQELAKATKDCVASICVISGAVIEPAMMKITLTTIRQYLTEYFSFLNCHEVQEAFKMNSVGKLDRRVSHYNRSLNCDYVGEVLQLYCDHRARMMPDILKAYDKMLPPPSGPADQTPFSEADLKTMLELAFARYRMDPEFPFYGVSRLYSAAVNFELITPGFTDDLMQRAKSRLRGKMAMEIERINKKFVGEMKELSTHIETIASGKPLEGDLLRKVQLTAMDMMLRITFQKIIEAGRDSLFSASS